MPYQRPFSVKWWWDSWHAGGFLYAMAAGMNDIAGYEDVWKVGGVHVSKIAGLASERWGWWTGNRGKLKTHAGHFFWSGEDSPDERRSAAQSLVKYLNRLHELAPSEPLRTVAHSHGGNVVKAASSDRDLSPTIYFEKSVFLACPHFAAQVGRETRYPYKLSPDRFGQILNLYSELDTVQTKFAEKFPGRLGYRLIDHYPPTSNRVEQDPDVKHVYEDHEIPTTDVGVDAHAAVHGQSVGYLVGVWLASNRKFSYAIGQFGRQRLPVPGKDFGE
jgi:hypothetical protein